MNYKNLVSNLTQPARRTLAIGVAAICGTTMVSAIEYTYMQEGYDEGASVMGSFSGDDMNGDGWLNFSSLGIAKEISAFDFSFSGNSMVQAFSFGLGDLQDFSFSMMGNNLLGDDVSTDPFGVGTEGIAVFDTNFGFFSGQSLNLRDGGEVQDLNMAGFSSTDLAIMVTGPDNGGGPGNGGGPATVPDTGSTAVLLMSGIALVCFGRRKLGR